MPFLPREGLTIETVYGLFQNTLFEPLVIGPLLTGSLYFPQQLGSFLPPSIRQYISSKSFLLTLKVLFGYGVARQLNNYLSRMVLNNWTKDTWQHGKEIAIVTGGAGGIGEAIVRELSGSCAHVISIDLVPAKKPFPSNVHFYKVDLTSPPEISSLGKEIRKTYGDPTVLINNAGISLGRPILNQTDDQLQRIFDVNILAHFRMVREFVPAMAKANHGHIVSIASMNSYMATAQSVDYCATKAAALTFHHGLGQELKHFYNAEKVRTTVVTPTYVRTPMVERTLANEQWKKKGHFVTEPETIAEAIVKQLHSGTGAHLVFPGRFWTATMLGAWPYWAQKSLLNSMGKESRVSGSRGRTPSEPDVEGYSYHF